MDKEEYKKILENFSKVRALVIGDVMLDSYIWGKVDRISPEAPVPVVMVSEREDRLGGAANVALNFKSLGAEVILCSVVGEDRKGEDLARLLIENDISTQFLVKDKNRLTTTKFRILGNNTQLIRVDEETEEPLSQEVAGVFIQQVKEIIETKSIDVLLFQDYDKGLLDTVSILEIIQYAKEKSIPIAVDPKKKNFFAYQGVDLFKPNLKELSEGLNVSIDKHDKENVMDSVLLAKKKLNVKMFLLTLSENGIYLNHPDGDFFAPTIVREVADVSGAGDTLISVAALSLALGIEPEKMSKIANIAGGLVCEELGVVPISKEKMLLRIAQL